MQPIQQVSLTCPYCGEPFVTSVDVTAGSSDYIEDCPVCCQAIEMRCETSPDGAAQVTTRRQDE